MWIGFGVCVLFVLCFESTLTWNKNAKSSEEKAILKPSKYSQHKSNDIQKRRPPFYWEKRDATLKFPPSNDKLVPTSNHKPALGEAFINELRRTNNFKGLTNEPIISNDVIVTGTNTTKTSEKSKKRCKKGNCKRRHKNKRNKGKKNRKKNKNVVQVPKGTKNITKAFKETDKTNELFQKGISKFNYHKKFLVDKAKTSGNKLLSQHVNMSSSPKPKFRNRNSFVDINDRRILLASSKRKNANSSQFYGTETDILGITVPTTTEGIFKSNVQSKLSDHYYTEEIKVGNDQKINYSELLKSSTVSVPDDKSYLINLFLQKHDNLKKNMDAGHANKIGQCGLNNGGCAHFCNEYGSQRCSCLEGFELGADHKSCTDIDECSNANGGCESLCYNTQGSYYCRCPAGLRTGVDLKSCEDIDECLLRNGHGPCQDSCFNTFGSYYCRCSELNGTRLSKDKHTCEDINECKEGRSGCSHGCINTLGRAFCTCPIGMELGNDWKTCYDINECDDVEISNKCKYGCRNTLGSFRCLESPNEQNDQIPVAPENVVCPPLFPLKHGYFNCSRKKAALGFKTKYGRHRVTNRPGTFCDLICPIGYKNVGNFRVICNVEGFWVGEHTGRCSLFTKPKLKCPGPIAAELKPGEEKAHIKFAPPKVNVDWKYVEAVPPSAKKFEVYLPHGRHWITFKATDPNSKLTSKCIIYVVVRKTKIS